MKNLLIMVVVVICTLTSFQNSDIKTTVISQKQESKTVTFKVWGNCGSCKKNIETALKVKGISKADWNKTSKIITVTFDESKISLDKIHALIAKAGYDTDKAKGDDKAYSKLDACCQYDRK
jgi:mercuric ion binding protein